MLRFVARMVMPFPFRNVRLLILRHRLSSRDFFAAHREKTLAESDSSTEQSDIFFWKRYYPEHLRRIKYRDPETDRLLVFLTNDFNLPALMIAQLYKQRWQVELFFKWIKQHLRIKAFYGYSENAVRTQLWIAVAVYCLLAIIKKELKADRELHEIQEILSASVFQKMPILQAFSNVKVKTEQPTTCNYPSLFNL